MRAGRTPCPAPPATQPAPARRGGGGGGGRRGCASRVARLQDAYGACAGCTQDKAARMRASLAPPGVRAVYGACAGRLKTAPSHVGEAATDAAVAAKNPWGGRGGGS